MLCLYTFRAKKDPPNRDTFRSKRKKPSEAVSWNMTISSKEKVWMMSPCKARTTKGWRVHEPDIHENVPEVTSLLLSCVVGFTSCRRGTCDEIFNGCEEIATERRWLTRQPPPLGRDYS